MNPETRRPPVTHGAEPVHPSASGHPPPNRVPGAQRTPDRNSPNLAGHGGARPAFIPAGGARRAASDARLNPAARVRPPRSPTGRAFVYNGHAFRPFAAPRYRWPRGYFYRPIVVGAYLAPTFWSPNYFVVDYSWYGVAPPPPDYGWIRYGPDLLEMQLDTGQVAQDVPGAFDEGAAPGQAAPASYADAPPGFSARPAEPVAQPDVIPTPMPAYPTEPAAEAPPAFRYTTMPIDTGDPDELPGDPPPPGA